MGSNRSLFDIDCDGKLQHCSTPQLSFRCKDMREMGRSQNGTVKWTAIGKRRDGKSRKDGHRSEEVEVGLNGKGREE